MGKKLLIIGNGFDLAHKLPTRYADFLEFSIRFRNIYTSINSTIDYQFFCDKVSEWDGNECLKRSLIDLFEDRIVIRVKQDDNTIKDCITLKNKMLDRMASDITENLWFEYFLSLHENNWAKGGNWIDFESEISDVIQFTDRFSNDMDESFLSMYEKVLQSEAINRNIKLFYKLCDPKSISRAYGPRVEDYINKLYNDLERITDALNVYLARFIEKLPVHPIEIIKSINPDCVVSFNYTHTYQKTYNDKTPICYIHGECSDSEDIDCNMVIGIDEYLDEKERNTNTRMAIFKKFVQRIRKKNDTSYRQWHAEMEKDYYDRETMKNKSLRPDYIPKDYSDIYVFGHSLDVTDIDVLKLFLEPEYAILHIYSRGKMNEGILISNMIKIIKEETLIEKSYGVQPRLEFVVI